MKNKIVTITGATSGIGWATALAFKKMGAKLIICGRRDEKLRKLSKILGNNTRVLKFDVREKKLFLTHLIVFLKIGKILKF